MEKVVSQGNNEYDTGLCAIVEFLRSKNPLWWSLGQQAIGHQIGVDTISDHIQTNKIGSQAMHMLDMWVGIFLHISKAK